MSKGWKVVMKFKISKKLESGTIECLILFMCLYVLESMFFREETSASFRIFFSLILTFMMTIISRKKFTINKKLLLFLAAYIVTQVLSWAIHGFDVTYDIYNMLILLLVVLLVSRIEKITYIKCYVDFIYFIAIISTILWGLRIIAPGILSILPVFSGWHGTSDFRFAVLGIVDISSMNVRNFGTFYEPGLFGIYLNIALYFLLFEDNVTFKNRNRKMFVIIAGVLSTLSTSAFISIVLLLIAILFNKPQSGNSVLKNIRKTKRYILFISLLGLAFISFYFFNNHRAYLFLISKFNEISWGMSLDNTTMGSGYERYRSFIYALQLMVYDPIFGCGVSIFKEKFDGIIGTFTPLNWMCLYGFFLGSFINYAYLKNSFIFKNNIKGTIVLALFWMSLVVSQNLYNDFIILMLISYNIISISTGNKNRYTLP